MPDLSSLAAKLIELQNLMNIQGAAVMDDLQQVISQLIEQNAPVGKYGNTEFLKEGLQESSGVEQVGAGWELGFSSKELLPEPTKKPPEHTISDFLSWWNEQGFDSGAREPRNPAGSGIQWEAFPWWGLTPAQKTELENQRAQGNFGGEPPTAPYWWVQEVGAPGPAWIAPQHYFSTILQKTREQVRYRIAVYNKTVFEILA